MAGMSKNKDYKSSSDGFDALAFSKMIDVMVTPSKIRFDVEPLKIYKSLPIIRLQLSNRLRPKSA